MFQVKIFFSECQWIELLEMYEKFEIWIVIEITIQCCNLWHFIKVPKCHEKSNAFVLLYQRNLTRCVYSKFLSLMLLYHGAILHVLYILVVVFYFMYIKMTNKEKNSIHKTTAVQICI